MAAYPGLSKDEAVRALRVKAAVGALRRRGWDVGSALGELTARCVWFAIVVMVIILSWL
jgi:hypothetical protein